MTGFPWWLSGKESACKAAVAGVIPELEDPLEKKMATHSSILAWKIPWMEEPGRLPSIGLQRITRLSTYGHTGPNGWIA